MKATEKLQNAHKQLSYVCNVIENNSSELAAWELKEYQSLKADYELEISELNTHIKK